MGLFRSDKALSNDKHDKRSSLWRRKKDEDDEEIVELMRPRDTVVTMVEGSVESPQARRRRLRRDS